MDAIQVGLVKKTTILFPPAQYAQLARTARQRKTSVGDLVREACRIQYSSGSTEDRLSMVAELAALSLPVGTPSEMKAESVPAIESLP